MSIDRLVLAIAGTFILLSLALAWALSPWWLLFTAFVGLNMLQAAFTGFCPMAILLKHLGVPPGAAFQWPCAPSSGWRCWPASPGAARRRPRSLPPQPRRVWP